MLFLIYWLLPNRRLPWRDVVPVSMAVGFALEGLKYINLLTWPFLREKLEQEYGPFINSVTIILWSFLACNGGPCGRGVVGAPATNAYDAAHIHCQKSLRD